MKGRRARRKEGGRKGRGERKKKNEWERREKMNGRDDEWGKRDPALNSWRDHDPKMSQTTHVIRKTKQEDEEKINK